MRFCVLLPTHCWRKVSNGRKPLGHFQLCVHGHSSTSYHFFLRTVGQAWLPMKVMIETQWLSLIGRSHGTW